MAAGAKSPRKSATPKTADDGQPGASLPLTGNQPPPLAPVAQAGLSAVAALQMPAATNAVAGASAGGADAEDRAVSVLASTAKQIVSGTGLPSAATTAESFEQTGTSLDAAIDSSDASTELDGAKAIAGAGAPPLAGASNDLLGQPSGGAAITATAGGAVPSSARAGASAAAAAEKAIAKTPGEAALSKGAVQDTARDTVIRSGAAADDDSPPSGVSANTAGTASDASAAIVAAGGMAASTKVTAPAAAAAPAKPTSVGATSDGNSADSHSDSDASAGSSVASASAAGIAPSVTAIASPHQAAGLTSAQSAAALSMAANPDKQVHAAAGAANLGSTNGDAAAGLSLLSSNSAMVGSVAASATPTLQVHASIGSDEFSQGLSDRVSWMVNSGVNNAKLQVNPPQLGPIELSISVQGNQAQVSMTTHSAVTRDALEASSPQLREMLGAQGFGQVSVDISQRSFQDRSAYTAPYERASSGDRSAAATPAVAATAASTPRSSLGALDAYA
jgi:flagellar hook-length control protein FliK